jgi:hypothetical protein
MLRGLLFECLHCWRAHTAKASAPPTIGAHYLPDMSSCCSSVYTCWRAHTAKASAPPTIGAHYLPALSSVCLMFTGLSMLVGLLFRCLHLMLLLLVITPLVPEILSLNLVKVYFV